MAARDKRQEAGDKARDPRERQPSPLDHHRGSREELTPVVRGDEAKHDDSAPQGD
jgi:hypothetical protein